MEEIIVKRKWKIEKQRKNVKKERMKLINVGCCKRGNKEARRTRKETERERKNEEK